MMRRSIIKKARKYKKKLKSAVSKYTHGVLLGLLPIFSLPLTTSMADFRSQPPAVLNESVEPAQEEPAAEVALLTDLDFMEIGYQRFFGIERLDEPYEVKMERINRILKDFRTGLSAEEEGKLAKFIYEESLEHQYDPELILAVIMAESSFYNWSRSHMGAIGLMQIMPNTGLHLAKSKNINWIGNVTLFDPFLNIKLGIQYLAMMHDQFGDLRTALTAYNYGPARVQRMLDECRHLPNSYSQKVLTHYKKFLELQPEGLMES